MSGEKLSRLLKKGISLHSVNDLRGAKECYQQVLEAEPEQPEALYYMGVIDHAKGRTETAEKRITQSFKTRPRAEVGYNLSRIATQNGKPDKAMRVLQNVLRIAPKHVNAHYDLALLLRENSDYTGAIAAFEKTLGSPVHRAAATSNIGLCYQDIGDMDAARQYYSDAIAMQPDYARAWRQLAFVTTFTDAADPRITDMELAYHRATEDAARSDLAFSLGKAADDVKEYAKAFTYYTEGNRLKRKEFPDYATPTAQDNVAQLLEFFRPDYLQNAATSTISGSERMIFVLGMPRSGTTLVEQIVSSHSDVHGAGELDTLCHLLSGLSPDELATLDSAKLNHLSQRYLDDISRRTPPDAKKVLDKGLLNTRFVALIAQLLPHAKIIHCRRNAMDTCLSIFRNSFTGTYPFAYNLEETGEYYALYAQLMERFRSLMPAHMFYEIDYEALVAHQEDETRKLLDFCGLEWQEQCLRFHTTQRTVKTASALQVREPIYRSSVGAWERYGDAVKPLEHILRSHKLI
jgi:tetratricopeptide (TPR) repeat protein